MSTPSRVGDSDYKEGRLVAHAAQDEDPPHHQVAFATMTTFALFLLFCPSMISAVSLGGDPDVQHWFGWFGLVGWIVPLLLVAQHVLHARMGRPSRALITFCVLVPSVFFAVVGGKHRHKLSLAATRLYDADCFTFPEKAEIQQAYETARKYYDQCPGEPTVETCQPYQEAEARGEPAELERWEYLARVEQAYTCAGFCTGGKSLWTRSPNYYMPPCARFMAMKLFALAQQGAFVLWYSIATILLSFPAQLLIRPVFKLAR